MLLDELTQTNILMSRLATVQLAFVPVATSSLMHHEFFSLCITQPLSFKTLTYPSGPNQNVPSLSEVFEHLLVMATVLGHISPGMHGTIWGPEKSLLCPHFLPGEEAQVQLAVTCRVTCGLSLCQWSEISFLAKEPAHWASAL